MINIFSKVTPNKNHIGDNTMAMRKLPEKYLLKDHDFAQVMKGNPKARNVRKKMRRAFKNRGRHFNIDE